MDQIIELLKENLDIAYLLTILMTGYYFTKDDILSVLGSSKLKTFILGIPKAYKVLILSIATGLFFYFAADSNPGKLMFTFAFANSLYELLIKSIFNKIDSLTGSNKE